MKVVRFNAFDVVITILMVALMFVSAYPFLYIFLYSVSDPSRIGSGFLFVPAGFSLKAYVSVWNGTKLPNAVLISVLRSMIGPALTLLFTSMVAFVLTKRQLIGRKFLMAYFTITLYVSSGIIPLYMLYKTLQLTGTFLIYVIPTIISVFNMFIIKTYMEGLPAELFDSARIDGANDMRVYWTIVIPLCKPVLGAIALFECVNQWNAYFDTMIFNTMKPRLYTLQYVLYTFVNNSYLQADSSFAALTQGAARVTPMLLKMTITLITILPILFAYPFMQRYFVKGLTLGSVKG